MPYLLDANTFIQAKNEYYGFDICPGYWDWLERQNAVGNIFSIDQIGDELKQGNDELAQWASARGRNFFLPLDRPAIHEMRQVSSWVQRADYQDHAKRAFSWQGRPISNCLWTGARAYAGNARGSCRGRAKKGQDTHSVPRLADTVHQNL